MCWDVCSTCNRVVLSISAPEDERLSSGQHFRSTAPQSQCPSRRCTTSAQFQFVVSVMNSFSIALMFSLRYRHHYQCTLVGPNMLLASFRTAK